MKKFLFPAVMSLGLLTLLLLNFFKEQTVGGTLAERPADAPPEVVAELVASGGRYRLWLAHRNTQSLSELEKGPAERLAERIKQLAGHKPEAPEVWVTGVVRGGTIRLSNDQRAVVEKRLPVQPDPDPTVDSSFKWELRRLSNDEPPAISGAWTEFRGAERDNVSRDPTPLARGWPEGSRPPVLWNLEVGEGYAAPAVYQGRVFLLDYDPARKGDLLRCLSLADGKELWQIFYPNPIRPNHGQSRSVPAVTDRYVVTVGPSAHVLCAEIKTGKIAWVKHMVMEYNTKIPDWWSAQSPILDRGRVILAPAGMPLSKSQQAKRDSKLPPPEQVLMCAVELASGRTIWKTPNTLNWKMSHVSITPMTLQGRKTFVYSTVAGVCGVSADDGKLLWSSEDFTVPTAAAASPVEVGPGYLFVCGGYGAGSALLRIQPEGEGYKTECLYKLKSKEAGSEQQTPIFYRGNLYLMIPNGELICMDPISGKRRWSSGMGKFGKTGYGPYLATEQEFMYVMEDGVLTLVELNPNEYKELWRGKVIEGPETWAPLVLVHGRLFVRNVKKLMACLDVRQEPGKE